jgi:hypothetical protein
MGEFVAGTRLTGSIAGCQRGRYSTGEIRRSLIESDSLHLCAVHLSLLYSTIRLPTHVSSPRVTSRELP